MLLNHFWFVLLINKMLIANQVYMWCNRHNIILSKQSFINPKQNHFLWKVRCNILLNVFRNFIHIFSHSHFHVSISSTFFVRKCCVQLFSSSLGFVIFWCKNIGAKGACKMLVKLTLGHPLECGILPNKLICHHSSWLTSNKRSWQAT